MFGFILPVALLLFLIWIRASPASKENTQKKGLQRQGRTPTAEVSATDRSAESVNTGERPCTVSASQQTEYPGDALPDQHQVKINRCGQVFISQTSHPEAGVGDAFKAQWFDDQEVLEKKYDSIASRVSDLQSMVRNLDKDFKSEKRKTWSKERERFCRLIDDLMTQRQQLEGKIRDLKRKKKQRKQQVKTFVFQLDERYRELVREAVSDTYKDKLHDVFHRLANKFDIYTLGVDCGLNFVMEVKTKKWKETENNRLNIQEECRQILKPKYRKQMEWRAREVAREEAVQIFSDRRSIDDDGSTDQDPEKTELQKKFENLQQKYDDVGDEFHILKTNIVKIAQKYEDRLRAAKMTNKQKISKGVRPK